MRTITTIVQIAMVSGVVSIGVMIWRWRKDVARDRWIDDVRRREQTNRIDRWW